MQRRSRQRPLGHVAAPRITCARGLLNSRRQNAPSVLECSHVDADPDRNRTGRANQDEALHAGRSRTRRAAVGRPALRDHRRRVVRVHAAQHRAPVRHPHSGPPPGGTTCNTGWRSRGSKMLSSRLRNSARSSRWPSRARNPGWVTPAHGRTQSSRPLNGLSISQLKGWTRSNSCTTRTAWPGRCTSPAEGWTFHSHKSKNRPNLC